MSKIYIRKVLEIRKKGVKGKITVPIKELNKWFILIPIKKKPAEQLRSSILNKEKVLKMIREIEKSPRKVLDLIN